jgi:cytochrome c556
MKSLILWIAGIVLCMAGCVTKEPAMVNGEGPHTEAFIEHMHAHAERIDDLNYALADDDLVRAAIPAYWLSWHPTMDEGIPPDWQPFVDGMRKAARDVEAAPDLETARAASKRVNAQCQACHAYAKIETGH